MTACILFPQWIAAIISALGGAGGFTIVWYCKDDIRLDFLAVVIALSFCALLLAYGMILPYLELPCIQLVI